MLQYEQANLGRDKRPTEQRIISGAGAELVLLATGRDNPTENRYPQRVIDSIATVFSGEAGEVRQIRQFFVEAINTAHFEIIATEQGATPGVDLLMVLIQHGEISWAGVGNNGLYLMRGETIGGHNRENSSTGRPPAPSQRGIGDHSKIPCIDFGGPLRLSCGDKILLCSENLYGLLPIKELEQFLAPPQPLQKRITAINTRAKQQRKTRRNDMTLVALEITEIDSPPPPDSHATLSAVGAMTQHHQPHLMFQTRWPA
ncbi:MAG: hypothetical protein HQL48_09055 [Gammaproteobacteria bacterium]|nr:hypothetical protein [Gammaproteobacteria bacterium]